MVLQSKINTPEFLRAAILEGLKEDHFSQEIIDILTTHEAKIFVGKFPICANVQEAINRYHPGDASTTPQPSIINGFKGDIKAKKTALNQMVASYVDRHLRRLKIEGAQLRQIEASLKKCGSK